MVRKIQFNIIKVCLNVKLTPLLLSFISIKMHYLRQILLIDISAMNKISAHLIALICYIPSILSLQNRLLLLSNVFSIIIKISLIISIFRYSNCNCKLCLWKSPYRLQDNIAVICLGDCYHSICVNNHIIKSAIKNILEGLSVGIIKQ